MTGQMICDFCQCTDEQACPGGCFWIQENFCSTCWMALFRVRADEAGARSVALRLLLRHVAELEVTGFAEPDLDEWDGPYTTHALPRLWRPGDPI